MDWFTRPNLDIIDDAIDALTIESTRYSCVALETVIRKHTMIPWHIDDAVVELYVSQYKRHTYRNAGNKFPKWWDSPFPYKQERINALREFRRACIAAALTEELYA